MSNNVYCITAHAEAAKVGARIKSLISDEDIFPLASNQWMVKYEGTTQELAEKAGVRSGEDFIGKGIVLSVTTYSGRANTELWDWLKAKGF
jgi:hypothetical protein